MLRKISLVLNLIVVVISLTLFGYTFFAKAHLTAHARAFVTEKTISYSQPLVEITKTGLKSPISKKLITEDRRAQIETEVALYDSYPAEYIISLTTSDVASFGDGKAAKIKGKIRGYYESTLTELIRDLRIFSGSNTIAGLFALSLLLTTKFKENNKVVAFSFIVFAAVAYSSYIYIDGVSFFRILFKWHLGWWYPAGIAITIISLVLEHRLHTKSDVETD